MSLYTLRSVTRKYPSLGDGRVALDGISLTVERGELIAVLGTSGSGKSTLLNILGALDRQYDGEVLFDNRELRVLADTEAASLRQRSLGFVFQGFHLVSTWTVRQNIALPASFSPVAVGNLERRIDEVIERVGLTGRGMDVASALSGGQRQRVAIARALLLSPPVLLCDEPTGSLDHATGASILSLFESLHRDQGFTLIMVTHEERATAIAHRVIRLENGRIAEDRTREAV
jgi:putative ABC transport system ATP-binding protein